MSDFCPILERYNKNEVINDFKEFNRKVKLKAHFALQENQNIDLLSYGKNVIPKKSSWELDKNQHMLNTFIEAMDNNIENLLTKKTTLPK